MDTIDVLKAALTSPSRETTPMRFRVATPRQLEILRNLGSDNHGPAREWMVALGFASRDGDSFKLTNAGYVAMRLGELAPKLTKHGALCLKWFEYFTEEAPWRGRHQVEAALKRAGLLAHGSMTDKGREVRQILRDYDVKL